MQNDTVTILNGFPNTKFFTPCIFKPFLNHYQANSQTYEIAHFNQFFLLYNLNIIFNIGQVVV